LHLFKKKLKSNIFFIFIYGREKRESQSAVLLSVILDSFASLKSTSKAKSYFWQKSIENDATLTLQESFKPTVE